MYKFGPKDFLFWGMFLIIVVYVGLHITTQQALEDSEEQNAVLAERIKGKVHLDEYRTVVRSLDRCNWRLDEEQQDNFQMKDEVDHWSYISRLVNSADPDTACMLLIAKATRDFLWESEDDLYQCQSIRDRECWCPWPDN